MYWISYKNFSSMIKYFRCGFFFINMNTLLSIPYITGRIKLYNSLSNQINSFPRSSYSVLSGRFGEKDKAERFFHDNAMGNCTNAIDSRKTRNGARQAIESFHGEGYQKRSSKLVSMETFQALLQTTGGWILCGESRIKIIVWKVSMLKDK